MSEHHVMGRVAVFTAAHVYGSMGKLVWVTVFTCILPLFSSKKSYQVLKIVMTIKAH